MATNPSLFDDEPLSSGPVECLGQTFPSEEARREHYLAILREKLKDPAFRKIEGFPIGSDEDILALSDPPYYTACPNPFIEEYVGQYGTPYQSDISYTKTPFTTDVSEGKYDPLYKLHPYHTKVPHRAIIRYILQYTFPGDLIQDIYAGSGTTGIAAHLCGNREVVQSLGYRVDRDGVIYRLESINGEDEWVAFSQLGARRAVLSDLSPAASFIAYTYNTPIDIHWYKSQAERIIQSAVNEHGWGAAAE